MRRDFEALKNELEANNAKFTRKELNQLRYPDVKRAALAEAGDTACSPDLVAEELRHRLKTYLSKCNYSSVEAYRVELEMLGMWDDVLHALHERDQASKIEALPSWNDLSHQLRAYLLARCLRAHEDQPVQRLRLLMKELEAFRDSRLKGAKPDADALSAAGILNLSANQLLLMDREAHDGPLHVRSRLSTWESLTLGLGDMELLIARDPVIRDYHCTAGCFQLPGAPYV